MARTTMFVEVHWSTIKQSFLKFHTRPRPEFLLFLLHRRIIPKYTSAYNLIVKRAKTPSWYRDFVKELQSVIVRQSKSPIEQYGTNKKDWICQFPAYLSNRFTICKHLIDGSGLPQCRDIIRRRSAPFYTFRRDVDRKYPLIGGVCGDIVITRDSLLASERQLRAEIGDTLDRNGGQPVRNMLSIEVR